MLMGHCIDHTQCPECVKIGKDRHGNNLAIYNDGSLYCFSCGYFKSKYKTTGYKTTTTQQKRITLPYDITDIIPNKALDTLLKYNITENDIKQHHLMWSDHYQRIYFPIFSSAGLDAYLGRYCGDNPTEPKWYTKGNLKDILHIIGKSWSNTLVLTEDIISAIRVTHVGVRAMPIFGSYISALTWLRLRHISNTDKIILWLDKDKWKESVIYAEQGRQFNLPVKTVSTTEDPKALLEETIKKVLDI
jgi:hypothetical protein